MTSEQVWGQRLLALGQEIQQHLRRVLLESSDGLALPVAHEGGDTVYALDRHVEPVIERALATWPDADKPLLLISEGLGPDGRKSFGRPGEPERYRLIVDPVDGTRGLMYDKRSAWFLAAVARNRGEATTLADAFASVIVELPTTKQGWADAFLALSGERSRGFRRRLESVETRELVLQPSLATTLKDGFAHVVSFFPGTKVFAAELLERIVARTLGALRPGAADVFDDQYISSGGQMVELILGHDRFCCDLRPLFYEILGRQAGQAVRGLECHPYDVAGALVAQRAGVIITDGWGRPLDCPLDVHTGVHWCGYANSRIRDLVEPVVRNWLIEKGLTAN